MKKGRIILLLAAASMIVIGTSLAQESGTIDLGQDMTEVDTGELPMTNDELPMTNAEQSEVPQGGNQGPMANDSEYTSGESESGTLNLEPDPIPHLIISEVYYDGTDERIEITNIGDGDFQGNFSLAGVKSTLLTLTNVSLLSGQSKIFGDTLSQVSGNRFIGKTGLSLNLIDTAPIVIQLTVSGQAGDDFLVDQYRVNEYNDKKTSFEKLSGVTTRVQTGRVANALSGYTVNPGMYGGSGTPTNVAFPPGQSGENSDLPVPCVSLDPRGLLKVVEIFPGSENYPPYIELALSGSLTLDSLSISGDLLGTGLTFLRESSGTTLENKSFLLISSSGYRNSEGFQSVRNDDFSLVSTGNRLVITIGYRQSRRVMDIVYLPDYTRGSSYYFAGSTRQCAQVLDSVDYFSPGFERRFLKYLSGMTMTKIEYLPASTGTQSSGDICPSVTTGGIFSGESQVITTGFITGNYTISITNLVYDPEGSDTDKETVTLLAHHISGDTTPLDLSKTFRLKVNGTNKTLPWTLPMDTKTTFTKTFGFPNSTEDGSDVVVQLTYGDYVFATYRYNPNAVEEETLTGELISTGLVYDLSGISFQITYVLPNPVGKDTAEELGLHIYRDKGQGTGNDDTGLQDRVPGSMSPNPEVFDLSQGFTLRREKTKKKLSGFVIGGQENILSGNLGLVNKAACISLFYQETELTKFCYRTPKEGEKISDSDIALQSTSAEDLTILSSLKLKKIDNKMCIWYKEQSFLCKSVPAGKAAQKTVQEQKLYKAFASMIKSYLISDWTTLYYSAPFKQYFDQLTLSKAAIAQGKTNIDIYGQFVPVTNISQQIYVLQHTLPGVVGLWGGIQSLHKK